MAVQRYIFKKIPTNSYQSIKNSQAAYRAYKKLPASEKECVPGFNLTSDQLFWVTTWYMICFANYQPCDLSIFQGGSCIWLVHPEWTGHQLSKHSQTAFGESSDETLELTWHLITCRAVPATRLDLGGWMCPLPTCPSLRKTSSAKKGRTLNLRSVAPSGNSGDMHWWQFRDTIVSIPKCANCNKINFVTNIRQGSTRVSSVERV